jgi:hypothetical protein
MGYLRVRYNLMLAILYHSVYNAIVTLIFIIFISIPTEKLNIENEDYRIKIEEISPYDDTYNSHFSGCGDSVVVKGNKLKVVLAYLTEKEEYLMETNNQKMFNKRINLEFINYSIDASENKNIILSYLSQLYNFNIVPKRGQHEVWKLQVQDLEKLNKYKNTRSDLSSKVTTKDDEIKITNANLSMIADCFTKNFYSFFIYDNHLLDRFDMTFPTKNFSELKEILSSEYGISLIREVTELDCITVNFAE